MKKALVLISAVLLAAVGYLAVGTLAAAATVSYDYDDAGRLIRVTYPNTARITFSYDPAGNLLSRTMELPIPGDVSGSRQVEMGDAILLLQYDAEIIPLTEEQKNLANLSGHEDPDDVGAADAVKVMSIMTGKELEKQ
jgi:YD repeat-containing protein